MIVNNSLNSGNGVGTLYSLKRVQHLRRWRTADPAIHSCLYIGFRYLMLKVYSLIANMEASHWSREGMNQPIAAAKQSVPSP